MLFVTLLALPTALLAEEPAEPVRPFRIEVVDAENGWPVPMVELRTTHHIRFITDNAGIAAFDLPELMGKETWLHVNGDGYQVKADGFGMRGVRVTPIAGKSTRIKVTRTIIAKRLGRLTGAGLFAESQRCGLEQAMREPAWRESGIVGCDSVQTATYRGKHFWLWGDTTLAKFPLGIFHSTSATTSMQPLKTFVPPLRVAFDYFRDGKDGKGKPRGVSKMPGNGPTWITGYANVPDAKGNEHLVATYTKIKPPLNEYEVGLCVWNNQTEQFDRTRVLWNREKNGSKPPPVLRGHPVRWSVRGPDRGPVRGPDRKKHGDGKAWLLFGDPFPAIRCPATFEAWANPDTWETLQPQQHVKAANSDERIKPHRGSIAWNAYRKRWVAIFTQHFGKPSAFGEIWYAEADAPTGPWGPAVKVLSHANYTFYNPRLHPEFTPADSPILLFEGTYTHTFANRPTPTPRYDYNQLLYRLDLDDPKLKPATSSP